MPVDFRLSLSGRSDLHLASAPPVGNVPVAGAEVGGRDDVLDAFIYRHDIEAGVEGEDIKLARQAFEEPMVGALAVGEDDAVAALRKCLIDDGIVDAGVVAEVRIAGGGNL